MSTPAAPGALPVAFALWRRSLNEVLRVRGALLPATIAPVVFLLGMSGQFGRLTGLDGFPTDSYLSWIVPLSCLQGAGFAGAATGSNLARDIEQGWFDRLLVAPVPRPLLLVGPILGAVTRSLVPGHGRARRRPPARRRAARRRARADRPLRRLRGILRDRGAVGRLHRADASAPSRPGR